MVAVIISHWTPGFLGRIVPWGTGVQLFFVLSGFLITGILLDCRAKTAGLPGSRMYAVRQFYIRRFLRIFPVYYLVVALSLVIDLPPARQLWAWLISYTLNVHITLSQTSGGPFGHFWSLAVEEQFYLIWPWVVLFAPRKAIVPLIVAGICLAPAYRAWAYKSFPFDIGAMDFKAATFTAANLDTLGAGALLALLWRSGMSRQTLHRFLTSGVLPIGALLYVAALTLYHYRIRPGVFFVVADLASAMVFAWLVSAAARGFRGTAGRLLQLGPLVYLGRISYGIYVYHNFSSLLLAPVLVNFGIPTRPSFTMFVLSTALSVSAAMISWHAFELPINKLKRRFENTPAARRPPAEGTPVLEAV